MQLAPEIVLEPCGSDVFSVRFSPDDAFLASACALGQVNIYNVSTGQEAYRLNRTGTHPIKQICWRPEREDSSMRTRGVLMGASTDGTLRQWHVTTSRCLAEFRPQGAGPDGSEDPGQLFCVDYSTDGACLVAGGTQELWAFDEETKRQTVHLRGGDSSSTAGHSSRIYACHFHPTEAHTIVSGGWDSSVQIWDLRVGHAVRAVWGPHVGGDAIDISADGRQLLTGSWREQDPLEIWDFRTEKRIHALPWRNNGSREPACLLYTARLARDYNEASGKQLIAAGGSFASQGEGEAKVIELAGAAGSAAQCHCAGTLVNFTCLSADFSRRAAGMVAFGGSDGRVRIMRTCVTNAGGLSEMS